MSSDYDSIALNLFSTYLTVLYSPMSSPPPSSSFLFLAFCCETDTTGSGYTLTSALHTVVVIIRGELYYKGSIQFKMEPHRF